MHLNDKLTVIANDYQDDHDLTDDQMAEALNVDTVRYMNHRTAGGDGWSMLEAVALARLTGSSLDELAGMDKASGPGRLSFKSIDEYENALTALKACAASINAFGTACEVIGEPTYAEEYYVETTTQLYEVARRFDRLKEEIIA